MVIFIFSLSNYTTRSNLLKWLTSFFHFIRNLNS